MMRMSTPVATAAARKGRRKSVAHIILLYLSLLGAALLCASCGNGSGEESAAPAGEGAAATVAASPSEPILRWMGPAFVRPVDREIVARCAEEIGMAIELLPAPANPLDRLGLYRQFLPAKSDDIDLIDFDVIWSGTLAPHLLDLKPHLAAEERAQYFAIYLQNNSVGDALVGLPQMGDIGLLYYRTDLLEKHGFQQPPATWSELEEMAATIQAGERDENAEFWGYVWQGNVYEGLTVNAVEWQASMGGDLIVDADGRLPAENSAAAQALDRAAAWGGRHQPADGNGLPGGGCAGAVPEWQCGLHAQLALCVCAGSGRRQPDPRPVRRDPPAQGGRPGSPPRERGWRSADRSQPLQPQPGCGRGRGPLPGGRGCATTPCAGRRHAPGDRRAV